MSTWLSAMGYAYGGFAGLEAVRLLKKHKPKSALGVGLVAAGLIAFGVIEGLDAKNKEKNNVRKQNYESYNPQPKQESIFIQK